MSVATVADRLPLLFECGPVDAFEARLLARELASKPTPFLRAAARCVKESVPLEAVGPVRPKFISLSVAAMFEEQYLRRFALDARLREGA